MKKSKEASNPKPISYKKLFPFPVLWQGWETDNNAWVAETPDKKKILVMQSHGTEIVAPVGTLEERIREYEAVLESSKKALDMLRQDSQK